MKVSFFIAGPGIRKGRSDALVYLHEILPTIAEFAGDAEPKAIDGMDVSDLKLLKRLKEENLRLKRLVADQALDIQLLKEVNGKKW